MPGHDAAVMNWSLETVVEGMNGWTCLPDRPDTPYAYLMIPIDSR